MQIENQPPNILKILAGEDASSLPQKFIQKINLGQFLKGQVVQIFSQGKSLVNFAGQKIVVEGTTPFRIGQNITAQVEQLQPAPVLRIIPPDPRTIATIDPLGIKQGETIQLSSKKNAPISFFSKTDFQFLKLSQDKIYRAAIKQVIDPETAVVQIKDRNFLVSTNGSKPLNPGDRIPVIAGKAANGSFHLLQSGNAVINHVDPGMIKPYLPAREGFGEMMTRLAAVVGELSSGSELAKSGIKKIITRLGNTLQFMVAQTDKTPSAQTVRELVNGSGMNYESKLKQFLESGLNPEKAGELSRDLKGQLLDIIRKLENQTAQKSLSSTQLQFLKDNVQIFRNAVDNIELHQLTHQLAKQDGQSLLLQIPNPFGQGDSTIKFYVRPSDEENGEGKGSSKKNFNLVFLLELSTLGNLRVDSQISENRLSVKMTVENQTIADFISSQTESFQSRIADMDLVADLTCCVQENIDMTSNDEMPKILLKDEFRLVDLTT